MSDRETLDFYDRAAVDYADRFHARGKPDGDLRAFMAALPDGGEVLDLGCGPGRSSALLKDAGFRVDAMDASEGMIRTAAERYGVTARMGTFADLDETDRYDGIWANFSLLHAPRAEFPGHLSRIARALKPGGVFHLGLKLGSGEQRDKLGRCYTYYTQDDLARHLADAGLAVFSTRTFTSKGMAGTDDPGTCILSRKAPA